HEQCADLSRMLHASHLSPNRRSLARRARHFADRQLRAGESHRSAVQGGHQRGGRTGQVVWRHRRLQVREWCARQARRRSAAPGSPGGQPPLTRAGRPLAGEFDLIARHFKWPAPEGVLGVGDDCALLPVSPGHRLAVTTDLLIEGRHFLPDVDPEALGHKALAVNISDLAAMGARPLGCVLGISVPSADHDWLEGFARGFRALADASGCPLVGGDTTRSMHGVAISVTAMGEVPLATALTRSGACRSEEHTSELQSRENLVCRLLLEKKKIDNTLVTSPVRRFMPASRHTLFQANNLDWAMQGCLLKAPTEPLSLMPCITTRISLSREQ